MAVAMGAPLRSVTLWVLPMTSIENSPLTTRASSPTRIRPPTCSDSFDTYFLHLVGAPIPA